MRILITGGTSILALSCAATWLREDVHHITLIGRDATKLKAASDDLQQRFPESVVDYLVCDLLSASAVQECLSHAFADRVDLVLIAQGSLTIQPIANENIEYLGEQISVNISSVSFCAQIAAKFLERQKSGQLAIIGSVAGDRGRAYNYSYGASKAYVECLVEGLQQRFGSGSVKISVIKPGPTATPMTTSHVGRMSDPGSVSEVIVRDLHKGKRVIYAPKYWSLIMLIVRNIPFAIYRKIKF